MIYQHFDFYDLTAKFLEAVFRTRWIHYSYACKFSDLSF